MIPVSMRLLGVDPTVLFPKQQDGNLRQLVRVRVASTRNEPCAGRLSATLAGSKLPDHPINLPPGESALELLLPDIAVPSELTVEVHIEGETGSLKWQGLWNPARKWQVFAVKASHYDLGYDGRIDIMQREAADFLDIAARLCTDKDQLHDWHYHIEHLRFLRAYERERGPVALASFIQKYIRTGAMTLLGNSSGPHFHWMDYEQLARFGYPARRELRDRYGLDIRTISVVDNPSASWAAYQTMAQSGFKYLLRFGHMGFRSPGSYLAMKMPPVAWMTGPDGHHRVLATFHESYSEPIFLGSGGSYGASYLATAANELDLHLAKLERGELRGPYPYDVLIVSNYVDWEVPHEQERVLSAWQATYDFPRIRLDDVSQALEHIEKNFAGQIPVLCADTNNNSGDYSSIDPVGQGLKRRLSRWLPFVEGLHTLATLRAPERFVNRTPAFNEHYLELVDFDEHCWPTMLSANDQNIFNTVVAKQHGIERVSHKVKDAFSSTAACLLGADHLPAESRRLAVWNSLARSRTGCVEACWPAHLSTDATELVDERTGLAVPYQVLDGGRILFSTTVPAYGFACFALKNEAPAAPEKSRLEVTTAGDFITMRNPWYEIVISSGSGRVLHVRSLVLHRDLLDSSAKWDFNAMIRCHAKPFSYSSVSDDIELTRIGTAKARVVATGPVRADVEIVTLDPALDVEVVTTLSLFAGTDEVKVVNDIRRMGFLHTPREDRYRENVFIAFPFSVPEARFRFEQGPGTLDAAEDFVASNRDFVLVNRWIDVAGPDFGITFCPHEALAVHCGQVNYNKFRPAFHADTSHLYSYAWSNRMAGLTHLAPEDYQATLSYSFRAHAGDWRSGKATDMGWEQAMPLSALPAPADAPAAASFLEIDAPNVQITALKRAEQPGKGLVVRLVETEGLTATNVRLRLAIPGFRPARATLCNLVEDDSETPAVCEEDTISLSLGAYEFITLRIEPVGPPLPEIIGLEATAKSDSAISLQWTTNGPKPPGTGFHVFRTEVREEPPTLHTLVAYTESTAWEDSGLDIGKTYYYRVAAATPSNLQGLPSDLVSASTTLDNQTPPAPLAEIGVVALAPERLCLYWRRSPERDIALYKIYRDSNPDFTPSPGNHVVDLQPQRSFYQTYTDDAVKPGESWYYRALPVDLAGNVQTESVAAHGKTPGLSMC